MEEFEIDVDFDFEGEESPDQDFFTFSQDGALRLA